MSNCEQKKISKCDLCNQIIDNTYICNKCDDKVRSLKNQIEIIIENNENLFHKIIKLASLEYQNDKYINEAWQKNVYFTTFFWSIKDQFLDDDDDIINFLNFLLEKQTKFTDHIYYSVLYQSKKVQNWVLNNLNYLKNKNTHLYILESYKEYIDWC